MLVLILLLAVTVQLTLATRGLAEDIGDFGGTGPPKPPGGDGTTTQTLQNGSSTP